jgi:hypothetical protein
MFTVCIVTQNSIAASSKISGRIVDAQTNNGLMGVNVTVEETMLGAATDEDGNFIILLPPGTYNIKATMMGYDPVIQRQVRINIGLTTVIDFVLNPSVVEGQVIEVLAKQPIVRTDVASSQTILQGTEVSAMPVSNFKEVLDKQVGVREVDARGLFMRGQRQSAISLMVDGMSARDNMDDQVYTRFNPDELEQVEINAGGYDASYGDASAGVITLVSKTGGKTYSGTIDYRSSIPARKHFGPGMKSYWDQYYFGSNPDSMFGIINQKIKNKMFHDDYLVFADRIDLIKELYHWRMRDDAVKYGDKSDMVVNATFGGPVPYLKNTTFFTSYRREKNYYLYAGPLDHYFDQNGSFKLTSNLTNNMKLSLTYRYTESSGLNRYDYYLMEASRGDLSAVDPDFQTEKRYLFESVEQVAWSGYGGWPYTGEIGMSDRITNQYGITFTHQLSPRTFYEIKLMATNFRAFGRQGSLRDTSATVTLVNPNDPTDFITLEGPNALGPVDYWPTEIIDPFMKIGGSYGYSERNYARDISLRANLTSQLNKYNQINVGFQYTYYDINKKEDRLQLPGRDDQWRWHVYPQAFSFWASDKLEFEGMILDLGLRGDLRIPDEWLDWRNHPWDYHWSDLLPADSNMAGPHYNPPAKLALGPRLKVSHPIGENAKIFFNWGHYYQNPSFERQYMFYRRQASLIGGGWTTYGDPELPYIKTVQYELGYEQNILNIFRLALSGYYKDTKNLLMDRMRMDGAPRLEDQYEPNYAIHNNSRYLNSQGFEARIEKKIGRFWTAWFNFNYEAYSRGVYGYWKFSEDPTETLQPYDYAEENRTRAPESRFNFGLDIHTPSQFGPRFIGFHPAADMSLNLLLWWRQQPAFSYDPQHLEAPYTPRDNMRWKPHYGVNLVFTKRFEFGSFVTPVFYLEVYNLFNTKNMFRGAFNENPQALIDYINALEDAGGKPGEMGHLAEEAIGNNPQKQLPLNGSVWDLFLNPRQIWFGLRLEIK